MRLFIAATVSPEVKAAAGRTISDLKKSGADFKWVEPENLHLTLRFLGETPEDRLPELKHQLEEAAAGRRAFSAALGGIGAFDSLARPRVLWIGLSSGAVELGELAHALGPLEREFSAHLTIGRMRSARNLKALQERIRAAPKSFGQTPVDRIVLFESRLSGAGPKYSERACARLAE